MAMEWFDFTELMRAKFCPAHELRKLQQEFTKQEMVGADYVGYTNRLNELSWLIPHLVTPESVKIEKYVLGLNPHVRTWVENPMPDTLLEAVSRTGSVTENLLRSGVLSKDSNKRKDHGETSGVNKTGRFE